MARIGHASRPEGSGVNGAAGDQTGKEVCIRQFYSMPADFMAIHPDAKVRERHAAACEAGCLNDNIGYSQFGTDNRNTLNTLAKQVGYDLKKITKACNTDCSAFQNVCAVASGASVSYGSNGWVTSNMRKYLKEAGYIILTDAKYLKDEAYCVKGAIYVKESQHTYCALDDGSKAAETLKAAGIGDTTSGSTGTQQTSDAGMSKSPQWVGEVTASALNVRTGAGTKYGNLAAYPLLKKGNKVDVCDKKNADDGVPWYYVRIEGKYFGFVSSKYISAGVAQPETAAQKEYKVGDKVRFTGTAHYTSSYAGGKKKAAKPCDAKITQLSIGKPHPYHVVGSSVYGWADAADIK